MMRKDVKVGLASGAVLVVVAGVYVSSLTKTPTVERRTSVTKLQSNPGDSSTGTTAGTSATNSRSTGISITGGESSPLNTNTVVDRPATPTELAPPASGTRSDVTAVASATGSASAQPDWEKILNQGPLPSLMTHETATTPTDSSTATASTATDSTPATGTTTAAGLFDEATPISGTRTTASLAGTSDTADTTTASFAAAPTAPVSSQRATYTVKSGDSFYLIAKAMYGNSHYYPHILRANPTIDPNRLKPGMVIQLPSPSSVRPTETAANTRTTAATGNVMPPSLSATATSGARRSETTAVRPLTSGEYRVAQDDNLYRIAVKLYGSPKRMLEIYELNKASIGSDPAKLRVGAVLKLPAK